MNAPTRQPNYRVTDTDKARDDSASPVHYRG